MLDDTAAIAAVRRFNRTVTQRVGALDDHYLSRDRTLGESRVLWEIGPQGCSVKVLRARLDLDSGYLSRLLRALETKGLVVMAPSPTDKRVRVARLTARGVRECAVLDRRSDELATSLLEPLNDRQRARLVAAMEEVRTLLTAALVVIEPVDPADADARFSLQSYFAELDERFDAGFEEGLSSAPDADIMRSPNGLFLVARLHGEPVGCGGLIFHDPAPPDIKRMWVSPTVRGCGVGRRLLEALEAAAREHGARKVRLETNRTLTEAIAMYRNSGYEEVPAFNDERYAHHWFVKRLPRRR